jgi:hypothetical protein
MFELPAKLSSSWVKRPQGPPGILAGYGVSTEPVAALLKGLFLAEVLAALFSRSHIEKSGLVVREFTKLPPLKRSFAESQWAWILNSLTGLLRGRGECQPVNECSSGHRFKVNVVLGSTGSTCHCT